MNKKKKREVVLKSGAVFPITGETSLYYICKGTQFKKSSQQIEEVREMIDKLSKIPEEFPVSVSDMETALKSASREE